MFITDIKDLANVIVETRKRKGLTQKDVAFACNVGVRYIVDLENGKETCQIGKALKIVNRLGIKLEVADEQR